MCANKNNPEKVTDHSLTRFGARKIKDLPFLSQFFGKPQVEKPHKNPKITLWRRFVVKNSKNGVYKNTLPEIIIFRQKFEPNAGP